MSDESKKYWNDRFQQIKDNADSDSLTPWEQEFVENVSELKWEQLSSKQKVVLMQISEKVEDL